MSGPVIGPDSWVLQSHKVLTKSDQKQKIFINRTVFVNKQLTLPFNYLKNYWLNFAQNFRECLFNPDDWKLLEKSRATQFFWFYQSAVCLQNTYLDLVSYPFKIQKCNARLHVCLDKPVIPEYSVFFPSQLFVHL